MKIAFLKHFITIFWEIKLKNSGNIEIALKYIWMEYLGFKQVWILCYEHVTTYFVPTAQVLYWASLNCLCLPKQ